MRWYEWVALLGSLSSALLLVRTAWSAMHLSRVGGRARARTRILLGLILLLLFVSMTLLSGLIIHSGSPEYPLFSTLVLACCVFVWIIVRDQAQLEQLVAHRTSELTIANARLQSLLDNLPAGVVFARAPSGEPLLINRSAVEMLGITSRGMQVNGGDAAGTVNPLVVAHNGPLFIRPSGEPFPYHDLPLAQTLRTGLPHSVDNLLLLGHGQERRRLLMTATPVRDEGGAMTSAICVFQDITERERLQQMRDSLTHIIVHDLRNPLHAIAGYLELMAESGMIARGKDAQEYFRHVRTNCQNLVNMTTALLDISKMEAGELHLNLRDWRLREIWTEVDAEVTSLARLKRLDLLVKIPPRLSPVRADRSMLRRVLVNLVTNAICFAPVDSTIAIAARREGDFERISVTDGGPGIAGEFHELIFQKSGRIDTGAKGTYFSTGLGLAFCKMAVELQGGAIGVESEVGQGSTFWFTLPVSRDEDEGDVKGERGGEKGEE